MVDFFVSGMRHASRVTLLLADPGLKKLKLSAASQQKTDCNFDLQYQILTFIID